MVEKKSQAIKESFVDIFAMNTFSYAVSVPIELLISGMSWNEHLKVRFVALLLNTLVARPFGLWRSFMSRKFGISDKSSFLRTYLADTFVFLSFQLGGAENNEIIKATLTITIIAGFLGRPYGIYLDLIRTKVGLISQYELKSR